VTGGYGLHAAPTNPGHLCVLASRRVDDHAAPATTRPQLSGRPPPQPAPAPPSVTPCYVADRLHDPQPLGRDEARASTPSEGRKISGPAGRAPAAQRWVRSPPHARPVQGAPAGRSRQSSTSASRSAPPPSARMYPPPGRAAGPTGCPPTRGPLPPVFAHHLRPHLSTIIPLGFSFHLSIILAWVSTVRVWMSTVAHGGACDEGPLSNPAEVKTPRTQSPSGQPLESVCML